ncbi:MAG: arsenate reductase (glutaredoxin) [Alphaproteobacteria bacterium]|nr:arsenate reductase (glutaredoxin) [Alphaproteobacteria bacterium SS10]
MSATIYHNPKCGTSRNTLALLRAAGLEPEVVEYLKTPPSRERLSALIKSSGLSIRDVLREKGTPFQELGLGDETLSDDQLLDAMMGHPILINRPLVETPLGVRLSRPSEVVIEILTGEQKDQLTEQGFIKEDGQIVIPKPGQS